MKTLGIIYLASFTMSAIITYFDYRKVKLSKLSGTNITFAIVCILYPFFNTMYALGVIWLKLMSLKNFIKSKLC